MCSMRRLESASDLFLMLYDEVDGRDTCWRGRLLLYGTVHSGTVHNNTVYHAI